MPTYAILITYMDLTENNTELVSKARRKYASFKQLYFDSGWSLRGLLSFEVAKIPTKEKLKIYISGHGRTGIQYITDNDGAQQQSVEGLAALLECALNARATSMGASENTEVNMFSCSFGRTPDGGLAKCPAVRLHKMLAAKEVYVDLVARTEWLAAKPSGRVTMSPQHRQIDALEYIKYLQDGQKQKALTMAPVVESWKRRKTQFTKIRCTYRSGAAVVLIRDYDKGAGIHINSESLQGRCILWADNVINELVEYIRPPTEVADAQYKILYQAVKWYDATRDPGAFYQSLLLAIPNLSISRTKEKINFTTHRNTALLIKRLLKAYPGRMVESAFRCAYPMLD
jgi:hypothetical protein